MRNPIAILAVSFCLSCSGSSTEAVEPDVSATAAVTADATPTTTSTSTPTAKPSATASGSPSPGTGAFAAHVAPTLKGTANGKPFEAATACLVGPAADPPGSAYIEVYDKLAAEVKAPCGVLSNEKGARKLGLVVPWKDGAKVDLATLKPKKDVVPFFVMERVNEKKAERKDAGKDFKPTGSIEVLRAGPKDGVGRIKISMTAGKDSLEGEIDVDVSGDPPAP